MIETYFAAELEKLAAPLSVRELARAEGRLRPVTLRGQAAGILGGVHPTKGQTRHWGNRPNPFGDLVPGELGESFQAQTSPGQIGLSSKKAFRHVGPALYGRPTSHADARAQRGLTLLHEAEERKVARPTFEVPHADIGVLLKERRMRLAAMKRRGALKDAGDMMQRTREASGEEDMVRSRLRGIDPRLVDLYDRGEISGAARRFVEKHRRSASPISEGERDSYSRGIGDFVAKNVAQASR